MNFINRQVFNKKDLADFYNQLNQIYNLETKSFKAANDILQSNVYIKTDIDSSNIIHIIPTTETQYKTILADRGILNKVANIQCEPLKTCIIDKLQSTDLTIQDQISNLGFANVTIKAIAINENTTYTINTTDILDTNTININLNHENAFGSKACCIELPLIPHYTFTLDARTNNCIVSPASLGSDFDGTGGKPPKLGFKQITLDSVSSSFNKTMFIETASGATDITVVKASEQPSSGLYYDLVILPEVLSEAKTQFISPEDFWSSDPNDYLVLPLLDSNDEPTIARGFYFDSDIYSTQVSVYIWPSMVQSAYITDPSDIDDISSYKLTHILTNADNSGKLQISDIDTLDMYGYHSDSYWGNKNRLCYPYNLDYALDYEKIETFNLGSFTCERTAPEYYTDTYRLKSSMDHFFSGFKFEELESDSNLVQDYTININTPLLYGIFTSSISSGPSSFWGTIQRTDEGLTLTNLNSSDPGASFKTEDEINRLKTQMFQIQINEKTVENTKELMANDQNFKLFESVDFYAEVDMSRSIGYLIDTALDNNTREDGFYSDSIYFHGYRLDSYISIPEISYEPVFNNFLCYVVPEDTVSTSTNLPINLDLPLTMYSTVYGGSSSTWVDGELVTREYWQSVGAQENNYTLSIRVNQYRSIYDEADGTEVLNVSLTLPDPGYYIYGDGMSEIPIGQLKSQLFADGRGANHDEPCLVRNKNYIVGSSNSTALNYQDPETGEYPNLKPTAVNNRYGSNRLTEYHNSDCGTGYSFNLKMKLDYLTRTLYIKNPLISSYYCNTGTVTDSTINGYNTYVSCSFADTENLNDIYRVYVDFL